MRFASRVQQHVAGLDVSMQNAVFMRVMDGAGYLCDEFHRMPNRHRCVCYYFVKLAAFNKLHTEVAVAIAFAHLVDGHDGWVIETRRSFSFQTKAFKMRFGRPLPESDDF